METLEWPVREISSPAVELPHKLLTRRPFTANDLLDPATALLLPSSGVRPTFSASDLRLSQEERSGACLGIWMGSSFPVLPRSARPEQLTGWITNFPTGAMFDDSFADSLAEVGLGASREYQRLAEFHKAGFKVMATMDVGQSLSLLDGLQLDAALFVIRSAQDVQRVRDGHLEEARDALGATTPIILHGGPERHLPNNPAALGVSALLEMPA